MEQQQMTHAIAATNLADILERVLDKGIVIAGDIRIQIADIDLLTIKIRLMIASVEKAKEMGINWWEQDSFLSTKARQTELEKENVELKKRVAKAEGTSVFAKATPDKKAVGIRRRSGSYGGREARKSSVASSQKSE